MPLTILEERYQKVRHAVIERRLAAMVAETDWDQLPHFASADDFLDFLDRAEPTLDHPSDQSGKP